MVVYIHVGYNRQEYYKICKVAYNQKEMDSINVRSLYNSHRFDIEFRSINRNMLCVCMYTQYIST